MYSNSCLNRIWRERLTQLVGKLGYERYRLTNMVMMVVGMYEAGSVHLGLIARKIPLRVQKLSIERRLRRVLANKALRVRELYRPVAEGLIKAAGSAGQIHLLMDSTKVSAHHQLLMVAIAYRRRALPLAWTWVASSRGHSTTTKQAALLSYVHDLIADTLQVSLVGDCEFENTVLMCLMNTWNWDYVLRQRGRVRFQPFGSTDWLRCNHVLLPPGETRWYGQVHLTMKHPLKVNLILSWALGQAEPWFLATNLPCPQAAFRLYRRRMWIEEMFADFKRHGFDLETTHLARVQRLSRLTLLVALIYLWLIAIGEYVLQHRLTAWVDRSDRRDLSVARLGWDFLERCLALLDPIPIVRLPTFSKVSGS
jgi:hypothetical protein